MSFTNSMYGGRMKIVAKRYNTLAHYIYDSRMWFYLNGTEINSRALRFFFYRGESDFYNNFVAHDM